MAASHSRCRHYIFVLWFLLLSFFLSSPNLSRRRLDVCHTSTNGVALECEFKMQVWNLLHATRWKYMMQKLAKKSPHCRTLSGYIFAIMAHIDNRKKNLLSSNISSTCPHNIANFSPLTFEIHSGVWGTQEISTGFTSWLCCCSDVAHRRPTKLC